MEILKNGWQLIDRRRRHDDENIVIAKAPPAGDCEYLEPYATWIEDPRTGDLFHGNYFEQIDRAGEDFMTRK